MAQRLFSDANNDWLLKIRSSYGRKDRHYHTFDHVQHLLDLFLEHAHRLENPQSVELAIYFHDVWYDPRATEPGFNERRSVEVFTEYANAVHLSQQQTDRVTQLILATISHESPLSRDSDMAFFLDIDLAILAAPQEQYDLYANKIRNEYGHVSDAAYRAGRLKVLQTFLERNKIYTSGIFEGSGMEGRARMNIRREIEGLTL